MPDQFYIVILIIGVLAILLGMVAVVLYETIKIKRRLRKLFGIVPNPPQRSMRAESYYTALAKAAPQPRALNSGAWNDLELDDIYGCINACQSTPGDIRLMEVLMRAAVQPVPHGATQGAHSDAADICSPQSREELIALFDADPKLRLQAQYLLAKLGRSGPQAAEQIAFQPEELAVSQLWLYPLLLLLPFAFIPVLFYNLPLGALCITGALALSLNVYTHKKNKQDSGFSAVRYLASAMACAKNLAELFGKSAPAHSAALQKAAGGFRGFGFHIFVLRVDDMLERFLGFSPLAITMLPMLCYSAVVKRLHGTGPQTQHLFRMLGEADLAASVLSWRKTLPVWCHPVFVPDIRLETEGLYHPMLRDPVPNNAAFARHVLLTGSNASGKSTFIKALAIGCLTAQALNTCTAKAFLYKPGAVRTSMAVADSIVDGDSYFVAEVKSMRAMLASAANPDGFFHWLFIDEILKGTNTIERVAASAAVLAGLQNLPCLCFAATHDIELTRMLDGTYENYHFREEVDAEGVHFDYTLHKGPSTTRNAILLLERMDFPPAVPATARRLVRHFEESGDWLRPD